MTAQRDPDRLIHTFIEQGLSVLPDRVYDALRDQVEQTPQRAGWLAGSFSFMKSRALRYGIGAVAVLALVGVGWFASLAGKEPSPTPFGSPSAEATPDLGSTFPNGVLESGRYPTIVDGLEISFSNAQGWTGTGGWLLSRQGAGGRGGTYVAFWTVDNVYADPCMHVLREPPVGPSDADLAAALASLPGVDATDPVEVSLEGQPGLYLDLTIRDDIPCAATDFWLWDGRYAQARGEHDEMWIFQRGEVRLLVLAETLPGTSAADIADMHAIIDSLSIGLGRRFVVPGPTPAPRALVLRDAGVNAIVTVPPDWTVRDSGVVRKGGAGPSGASLHLWKIDTVYPDPCHTIGDAAPVVDPGLLSSARGTAEALASWSRSTPAQPGAPLPIATAPTASTIAGREAWYLELSIADVDRSACEGQTYRLWSDEGGAERLVEGANQHERIWLVTVGDAVLAIDATTFPHTNDQDLAALTTMLDSMEILSEVAP